MLFLKELCLWRAVKWIRSGGEEEGEGLSEEDSKGKELSKGEGEGKDLLPNQI